jgi:hypothetical protein
MQPMSTGRRVGAFLAVAIVSIIVAAGGILVWAHVTGPDDTPNAVPTMQAQVSGSELLIQGTTDLPDGTLLRVSLSNVRVESYRTIETIAHVSASRYESRLDMSGWRSGDLIVTTGFAPGYPGQPAEVVSRFGSAS